MVKVELKYIQLGMLNHKSQAQCSTSPTVVHDDRENNWEKKNTFLSPDISWQVSWEMHYVSYLFEKGTSELTAILLLLLSMDTTPPPRLPALPFTLMRSCRNCSCRCRGHSKSHTAGVTLNRVQRFQDFITISVTDVQVKSSLWALTGDTLWSTSLLRFQ